MRFLTEEKTFAPPKAWDLTKRHLLTKGPPAPGLSTGLQVGPLLQPLFPLLDNPKSCILMKSPDRVISPLTVSRINPNTRARETRPRECRT